MYLYASNTKDCSLLCSSFHGILQTQILEYVPFPSLGDLLDLGIKPRSAALPSYYLPFFCVSPEKPIVSIRDTNFYVCGGNKKGDNPCELSITDTDFCVYVRHTNLCVYVRHTDVSVYVEGRRESLQIIYYM